MYIPLGGSSTNLEQCKERLFKVRPLRSSQTPKTLGLQAQGCEDLRRFVRVGEKNFLAEPTLIGLNLPFGQFLSSWCRRFTATSLVTFEFIYN